MNIVFRTDASLQIGTGHVMRCLTLADALRERGADCRFVCREHPGNLVELIRDNEFGVFALYEALRRWSAAAADSSRRLWMKPPTKGVHFSPGFQPIPVSEATCKTLAIAALEGMAQLTRASGCEGRRGMQR